MKSCRTVLDCRTKHTQSQLKHFLEDLDVRWCFRTFRRPSEGENLSSSSMTLQWPLCAALNRAVEPSFSQKHQREYNKPGLCQTFHAFFISFFSFQPGWTVWFKPEENVVENKIKSIFFNILFYLRHGLHLAAAELWPPHCVPSGLPSRAELCHPDPKNTINTENTMKYIIANQILLIKTKLHISHEYKSDLSRLIDFSPGWQKLPYYGHMTLLGRQK